MSDGMKISKLHVRRFLGIKDVTVVASPGVNHVLGANGQGKTSLLNAIKRALKGGKSDSMVIHVAKNGDVLSQAENEADVAEIMLELDSQMIVRRRIASDGKSDVVVMKKEGPIQTVVRSPQAVLDALTGETTLNPVEFFEASEADKKKILLSLIPKLLPAQHVIDLMVRCGVDYSALFSTLGWQPSSMLGLDDLQAAEAFLKDQRHSLYRERETAEGASRALQAEIPAGYNPEAPLPEIDALARSLEAATNLVNEVGRGKERAEAHRMSALSLRGQINDCEARIAELKEKLSGLKIDEEMQIAAALTINEKIEKIVLPNVDSIKREIAGVQSKRELRAKYQSAVAHADRSALLDGNIKSLDGCTKLLRSEGPKLLWERLDQTPMKGIDVGISEDRITVGGVALDHLSTSEQVRFAVKLARATASEMRVICVDRFESLDPSNKAAFVDECANDGYQYWIAETSEGKLRVE